MTSVVFYFQVHQPYRLNRLSYFDVGKGKPLFDPVENKRIACSVAERCYVPVNKLLLKEIERSDGEFRCAFSLSGTVCQQLEDWAPEALESFQALAATGCVEFMCETSHHSLAGLLPTEEFENQVREHAARIERLFGQKPQSFRNTELIFDNSIAKRLEKLGFETLLGEGADRLLGKRLPQFVYGVDGCERLKLLLRSYVYSDDIAFRFSNVEWAGYPLMADTFAGWLDEVPREAPFIGLFMDYETFGEHQAADTGILDFLEFLPRYILENPRLDFRTPSEVAAEARVAERLDVPTPISWADAERDLTAWLGNPMQDAAHAAVYELAPAVLATGDQELLEAWRRLTTSDHTYYMCTKHMSDGDVHEYFSPYESPHDAFVNFMNVLDDLALRVETKTPKPTKRQSCL